MLRSHKELQSIKRKGEKSGYLFLEGERAYRQVVDFGIEYEAYKIEGERDFQEAIELPASVFKKLTNTVTPQSILVLISVPKERSFDSGPILVLDEIQDPGNLGTILRTAQSFGMHNILMTKGCVSIWNDKVLRSSLGAVLTLNIIRGDDLSLLDGYTVYGATLEGKDFRRVDILEPFALVVGNEGNGISKSLLDRIDCEVTIPMRGKMESLNVAIATAILTESFLHRVHLL